ncbi:hypothetical protein DTO282E5_9221 [Paecilomyces variotii]|nr:hypothetical protein DTO282E5_9221 [Paecilomyces variotii]
MTVMTFTLMGFHDYFRPIAQDSGCSTFDGRYHVYGREEVGNMDYLFSLTRGSVKSRTGLRSQKDKENISGPKSTMNGPHERNSIHDRGVVSPLFDTP